MDSRDISDIAASITEDPSLFEDSLLVLLEHVLSESGYADMSVSADELKFELIDKYGEIFNDVRFEGLTIPNLNINVVHIVSDVLRKSRYKQSYPTLLEYFDSIGALIMQASSGADAIQKLSGFESEPKFTPSGGERVPQPPKQSLVFDLSQQRVGGQWARKINIYAVVYDPEKAKRAEQQARVRRLSGYRSL